MTAPALDKGWLLATVAARPAGAKLDLSALARDMAPSVAQIVAALAELVADGALDPLTLRSTSLPTGKELAQRVFEAATARGIPRIRASMAIFGHRSRLGILAGSALRPVRQATFDQVAAWLAALPPVKLHNDFRGADASAVAAIGARLGAMMDETGGDSTPPAASPCERAAARPTGDAGGTAVAQPAAASSESAPPPAPLAQPERRKVPITATGAQLFRILRDEGAARGLTVTAVSRQLFGNTSQLLPMQTAQRTVREATRLKAEAWLNSAARPPGRSPRPKPDLAEAIALADQLDALVQREGLAVAKVGLHLFGDRGGLQYLRTHAPRAATAARIRAFLANPPLDDLRREGKGGKGRARLQAPAPVDTPPAKPKPKPLLNGLRNVSSHRAEAQAHIDAGTMAPPGNVRIAQLALQSQQAEAARLVDPVSQAQLVLQRKGWTVYRASVVNRSADKFVVSGCRDDVSEADLQLLAAGSLTPRQINERAAK